MKQSELEAKHSLQALVEHIDGPTMAVHEGNRAEPRTASEAAWLTVLNKALDIANLMHDAIDPDAAEECGATCTCICRLQRGIEKTVSCVEEDTLLTLVRMAEAKGG